MNNDFIIQCEEIYLDDMKRMKQDNLLAKEIIKNIRSMSQWISR